MSTVSRHDGALSQSTCFTGYSELNVGCLRWRPGGFEAGGDGVRISHTASSCHREAYIHSRVL